MKAETLLDSVVFKLTPTRTRYDLVIVANGKTEKIASGLLDPFLAHLKTAEDQIAKGGYSITLEPDPGTKSSWFTKDTLERFVRYVSTPEVLDRVNALDSEILQINEAIAIRGNRGLWWKIVIVDGPDLSEDLKTEKLIGTGHEFGGLYYLNEDLPAVACFIYGALYDVHCHWIILVYRLEEDGSFSSSGSKFPYNIDKEKAIILSQHGKHRRMSTGSTTQEVNSRRQLLRVLESRKTVLRREQGMAFARAVAAGFDINHMSNLIVFAKSFGASRLLEACLGFVDLWKAKQKSGQCLETVGAEALPFQSEFVSMKASHNVSGYSLSTKSNGRDYHASESNLNSQQLNSDHAEEFPALPSSQYYNPQNFTLPQWASHHPPVSHSYPVRSMSYYQSYPVPGSFIQSHDPIKVALKRHSMDDRTSDIESTTWEMDFSNTKSQDENGADFGMKTCRGQKSHKKVGNPGKRRSCTKHKTNGKSGSESKTTSTAESENEIHDLQSDSPSKKPKSSSSSVDNNGGLIIDRQEGDGENWQTFQKLLLRIQSVDTSAVDSSSNETQGWRRPNKSEVDPSIPNARDNGDAMLSDPISKNEYWNASNLHKNSLHNVNDESFIVPIRPGLHDDLVKGKRTDIIDMNSDFHSGQQKNNDIHNYEPNDLSIMPERGLERGSISFDPAQDFGMQIQCGNKKETKIQADVSKRARERLKGLGKERKLSNGQYSLEKQKMDTVTTKVKSSKLNQLADAKNRAEKLRAFKADLQKIKKEKEEEERKRLEELKRERLKRIAARSSLNNAQSSLCAPQTKPRKITGHDPLTSNSTKFCDTAPTSFSLLQRLPQSSTNVTQSPMKLKHIGASVTTNASPNSYKSSKFSDMQPSPSSPLQKLLRRSKNVAQSTSTPQKTIMQQPTRLFSSSSPIKKLPIISRGNTQPTRVTSSSDKGSKFSDIAPSSSSPFQKITKLGRLDDNNHLVSTGSKQSPAPVSRLQVESSTVCIQTNSLSTPQSSKMHNQAQKNKIRTMSEPSEKVKNKVCESRGSTSFNSVSVQAKKANKAILTLVNYEEDPIVEKTVVILEDKMIPSPGILCKDDKREGMESVSENHTLHAPLTSIGSELDNFSECKPERQSTSYQVIDPPTDAPQKFSNSPVSRDPNQSPFARVCVEEHNTGNLKHVDRKMSTVVSERINARACHTVVPVSVKRRHKIDEKPHSRGSPRGFKDLLKFPCKGKHSASNNSVDDPCRMVTTASNNVPTLKDLFLIDGHHGGPPPKEKEY